MKNYTLVDQYVGKRLREKRLLSGLTQSDLAERLGVTFQQVQKYELGYNRISASRLFMCSLALSEPVSYFFHGLEGQPKDDSLTQAIKQNSSLEHLDKEMFDIIRLFYSIESPEVRHSIKTLLKSISYQE